MTGRACFLCFRARFCASGSLATLALSWNKIGDEGAKALAAAVAASGSLATEKEYYTALLAAYLAALTTASPAASAGKRKYMCTHCGVPKKGHVCRKVTQPKKRKGSSARAVVKRMRK